MARLSFDAASSVEPLVAGRRTRSLDRAVRAVAAKDVPVSFLGESGSGKELWARRLHRLSARARGPFVAINCAAVPEPLFESELFGHERGAFTGATERQIGKVELAEGGTLFLDEVGDLPLAAQAKLLRFLDARRYMRVGGSAKLQLDARLVFATLHPLEELVDRGAFRADLYFRIQGVTLEVPPLRERREELPELIRSLLAETSSRHGVPPPRLTRRAKAALVQHDWPGNVRELKSALELVTLLHPGRRVDVDALPRSVRPAATRRTSREIAISLDDDLRVSVERILRAALALEDGDLSRAARRLGVSVRTLQRRGLVQAGGARSRAR